jgi:hypothetical protein
MVTSQGQFTASWLALVILMTWADKWSGKPVQRFLRAVRGI